MIRAIGSKRVVVLAAAAVILMTAAVSVVMAQAKAGAALVDKRDGKTYRTVVIGSQTWMAENLNYDGGGKCYDNDPSNCAKYGRLYTWDEAKEACPAGWHLPSDAEWRQLKNAVGWNQTAGKKLKSKTGWDNNGNGTDEHGFSALPGGYGRSDGGFSSAGSYGLWWSATEYNASNAWRRIMYYNYENVVRNLNDKTSLFSVRCLADD